MDLNESAAAYHADDEEPLEPLRCGLEKLPPPDVYDPVIAFYMKDVDRTLLRENLKLTPAQRAEKLQDYVNFLEEIQRAGKKLPGSSAP